MQQTFLSSVWVLTHREINACSNIRLRPSTVAFAQSNFKKSEKCLLPLWSAEFSPDKATVGFRLKRTQYLGTELITLDSKEFVLFLTVNEEGSFCWCCTTHARAARAGGGGKRACARVHECSVCEIKAHRVCLRCILWSVFCHTPYIVLLHLKHIAYITQNRFGRVNESSVFMHIYWTYFFTILYSVKQNWVRL